MKHRAAAPPGGAHRAVVTVANAGRRSEAASRTGRHRAALHRAAVPWQRPRRHVPRHAAPPSRPDPAGGLGLSVVAAAALSVVPVLAGQNGTATPQPGPPAARPDAAPASTVPPAPRPLPAAGTGEIRAATRATGPPGSAPDPAPTAPTAADQRAVDAGRASRDARRRPPPAWVHPLPGATVTSCPGYRWGVFHAGIDLAGPAGAPVRAAAAGRVVTAGWDHPGYGISVLVDHGDGVSTLYAHLAAVTVAPGQAVAAGRILGRQGSTGHSTGPHLHFEVHQGNRHQVDPARWLRRHGVDLGC